ncbi:MAG: hypothetical protein IJX71_06825, partial [Oscillospiraceae bacterium]|nr:hypothetical protein [Oscillospiraceae bacterium]
ALCISFKIHLSLYFHSYSDFSAFDVKTETKHRRNFTYDFQNIPPFPDLFPPGAVVSSSQIQARYR